MWRVKVSGVVLPWRYVLGPLIMVSMVAALPIVAWQAKVAAQMESNRYRAAQLDNTRWQRYVALLSNAPMQQLISSAQRTAFEVALRETAQALQLQPTIQIDSFDVALGDELLVDDELGSPITPTTVKFEATLNHAPALLTILAELASVAGWRIMEVRGCAMQRLVSELRLAAACSIDIYHWSWKAIDEKEF